MTIQWGQIAEEIRADVLRYGAGAGIWRIFYLSMAKRAFRPLLMYRLYYWSIKSNSVAATLFRPILWLSHRLACASLCMELPVSAVVGPGLLIHHGYGLVVNADAVIGSNVTLRHLTTIGATSRGAPVIGDNVEFGSGVSVIGPIVIGSGSTIGAGAIVTKNIPEAAVVYMKSELIVRTDGLV